MQRARRPQAAALALIVAAASAGAFAQDRESAERQRQQLVAEKPAAERAALEAERQRLAAEKAKAEAERERQAAEKSASHKAFERIYADESRANPLRTLADYLAAADAGNCAAAKRLGEIYEFGLLGVQRDAGQSQKWFAAARAQGCAASALAPNPAPYPASGSTVYLTAQEFDRDGRGREAIRAYTQAARAGNCEAAKRLGEIYHHGLIGIARDYAEGLKWYNAARVLGCDLPPGAPGAERRHGADFAAPALELGMPAQRHPVYGPGIQAFERAVAFERDGNDREAVAQYIVAAQGGHCGASKRLAEIHDKGLLGVERSDAQSKGWQSIAQSLCPAPVATVPAKPRALSPIPAALANHPGGELEAAGKGGEAVKQYASAARGGNCEAARRLGEIYDTGALSGVPRDYAEGLKWYNTARVLGCEVPMAKSRS